MAFFDHYSSSQSTPLGREFVKKAARLLCSSVKKVHPAAESVLEIGPGQGHFCELWLQQGGTVTALEANPILGEALSRLNVSVIKAVAPPLPFDSGEFDVAIAAHVIEHMPTVTQAIELVEEMARVVRPGGIVGIVAPDVRAWRFDFWNADYTHNYVTSPRRLEQLFFNYGLQVEEVILYSGYLPGLVGRVLRFLAPLLPGSPEAGGLWRQRLYKLRMTFLGNFLIIGRKA